MDKPTRELLKPDVAALDVPNDARLTLDASRAKNRAGESTGYQLDANFYKTGSLTVKANPPANLIGGRAPDTDPDGGAFIVQRLPGEAGQTIDPDAIKPNYDQQPDGF